MRPESLPNPGTKEIYTYHGFTVSSAVQVAEIPFADPLYRERVAANAGRIRGEGFDARRAGLSDDLGFQVVRSIRSLGEMDVYDLTVEDGHSFFCENVLVSNTFANYAEAREAGYEENIIPTQRVLSAELLHQGLGDFVADLAIYVVDFDTSDVRVLQEDENKLWTRLGDAAAKGLIPLSDFRRGVGLPVDDQLHDVYLRDARLTAVRIDSPEATGEAPPEPVAPPAPPFGTVTPLPGLPAATGPVGLPGQMTMIPGGSSLAKTSPAPAFTAI